MTKSNILYKEVSYIRAKFNHPKSDDYLDYKLSIQINGAGKQPVIMELEFDGIYPAYAPMPPEEHTIKAENLTELFLKLNKWFYKYQYIIKS